MKKYFILLFFFSLIACKENPIPKPENDLGAEKMEAIFYDIAILQAAQGYKTDKLLENGIDIQNYIYEKYTIDSLTFMQNQHYYASEIKKYQKIYENVLKRIEAEKTVVDTLVKKEPRKRDLMPEAISDSVKKRLQLDSKIRKEKQKLN